MRHFSAFLFVFILAPAASAAAVVDQSHIVTQSTGGTTISAGGSPGQSFTVGAGGLLSQIDVLLFRTTGTGDIGSLSLELWPVVGGGPAGSTPLFSAPINTSLVTATAAYVPIDISAGGLFVSPGEQYAIAVNGTATSNPRAAWTGGFPYYSGGARFSRFGAWDSSFTDNDYGFRTWVDSAVTPAGLTTLSLTPTSEWDASLSSTGGSVISTAGTSMRVDRAPAFNEDYRGLIEFNASGLPAAAKVRSAKLTFEINQLSQSGSNFPAVAAYGYQADGTPSDADARNLTLHLGTSAPITGFDPPVEIALNPSKISSMIQSSPGVGIVAYGAVPNLGVDIVASQLANTFPTNYSPPTLSLGYSIPSYPAQSSPTGDYNRDAFIDAADYAIWRKARGTIGPSPADGDNNGVVDQADYDLWRSNFGEGPDQQVRNGGFDSGSLSNWNVVLGSNTDVTAGFPKVETFDVDGDGTASGAMRVRLGRSNTTQFGGTAALEQQVLLAAGDYIFSADVASQSLETTANTGPGNYELTFDGKIVDQVFLNGTTINASQVIRDSLLATLTNVEAGYHTLRLAVSRGATNTRAIYQFIDDIQLNRIGPASAKTVPEPAAGALLLIALALTTTRHRTC